MILTNSVVNVVSLAYFENQLFYSLPGTIWSCELINNVCINHEKENVPVQNFLSIKFHAVVSDYMSQNPCKKNNGNCSVFCFYIPPNKKQCGCNVGFELNLVDSQSCDKISVTDLAPVTKNYEESDSVMNSWWSRFKNFFIRFSRLAMNFVLHNLMNVFGWMFPGSLNTYLIEIISDFFIEKSNRLN